MTLHASSQTYPFWNFALFPYVKETGCWTHMSPCVRVAMWLHFSQECVEAEMSCASSISALKTLHTHCLVFSAADGQLQETQRGTSGLWGTVEPLIKEPGLFNDQVKQGLPTNPHLTMTGKKKKKE